MRTPELPDPIVARLKLEERWRVRLEEAQKQYQAATAGYRQILEAEMDGDGFSSNGALEAARNAQSAALAEYSRVLHLFTDLAVNGRVPKEQAATTQDGCGS